MQNSDKSLKNEGSGREKKKRKTKVNALYLKKKKKQQQARRVRHLTRASLRASQPYNEHIRTHTDTK